MAFQCPASDRKDSTKELYAGLARTHLKPAPPGTTPLDRLRPSDVEAFVHRLLWPSRIASLAHKLVQLTMPGVPDT